MSGSLFVVTAPSGAGKTTLVRHLLARDPALQLSISYTTRPPRPGEADGREYHFVDMPSFAGMRDRGEFLEWAEVHGNFYATSRRWIDEQIGAGRDIVLEIDWQGAESVRLAFPAAIRIFILPPSVETLERRLRGRATDSDEVIRRRLAAARAEMRHVNEFDYVIINNELQTAVEDLAAIVRAARLSCPNQRRRYPQFFEFMEQD